MKTTRVTELGMLLALSLVLSYLESLLPVVFAVPGVKIGLANIITMFVLYRMNWKYAFWFMTIRVILSGILFSGISGIIYSFFGGLLCICAMNVVKYCPLFSILGVSVTGALSHNVGQVLVAILLLENARIAYYLPVLCISGVISGCIIGYLAHFILKQ